MRTLWRSSSLPLGVAMRLFPNYFGISCFCIHRRHSLPLVGRRGETRVFSRSESLRPILNTGSGRYAVRPMHLLVTSYSLCGIRSDSDQLIHRKRQSKLEQEAQQMQKDRATRFVAGNNKGDLQTHSGQGHWYSLHSIGHARFPISRSNTKVP